MSHQSIQYRILEGFDDSSITPDIWNDLIQKGTVNEIFLTWQWQKAWWQVFGRGKLLLITVEQDGKHSAIAPLFSDGGMIFFVGSGGSDYLDFIGDISSTDMLEHILLLAIKEVPDFTGFRFYHVPDTSPTASKLADAAKKQQWLCYDEGDLPSPLLDIKNLPEWAEEATRKKSLVRHENWFKKNGGTRVQHFSNAEDILPQLDHFFSQHIARWEQTPFPSLFTENKQQLFYKCLTELTSEKNWLRFTVINWQDKAIAYHFGFHFKSSFLWYKPSFDIGLASHSPGEVLLRQLLLQAIRENANIFDFGLGDEAFKKRFATHTRFVRTWGIYPSSSINTN